MSEHLLRRHAPITPVGWGQIDDEAKTRLTPHLAARRLVDLSGPHGWEYAATNLGHVATLDGPPSATSVEGTIARQRRVLPLAEFRVPFTVSADAVADADRGAVDVDFTDLDRACRYAALVENCAVFHGWPQAGIVGMVDAGSHEPLKLGSDAETYPTTVARAVDTLRRSGIDGPYALAIGPTGYTRIVETTEHGGCLLIDHLHQILQGSVVWSPGLDGALVASLAGGDFRLEVGQDLSVGYDHQDGDTVHFYLEESFSFRVAEPDAVIALTS